MNTDSHRLTLKFKQQDEPCLYAVEFWLAGSDKPTITPREDVKQLRWSQATMGMSLCFIAYKIWEFTDDKAFPIFHFDADDGPGASFANAIITPTWIKGVFTDPKGMKLSYKDIFLGNISGRGESGKPRRIRISESLLPPEAVSINWDAEPVGEAGLGKLDQAIRDQYGPHHNLGGCGKHTCSATPARKPSRRR